MCDAWLSARDDLEIEVISPFQIEIGGKEIMAIAYLPDFGAKKGTLIFSFNQSEEVRLAVNSGFFCSQVNQESYRLYDRSHFQETLDDFQWYSKVKKPPKWYTGKHWG